MHSSAQPEAGEGSNSSSAMPKVFRKLSSTLSHLSLRLRRNSTTGECEVGSGESCISQSAPSNYSVVSEEEKEKRHQAFLTYQMMCLESESANVCNKDKCGDSDEEDSDSCESDTCSTCDDYSSCSGCSDESECECKPGTSCGSCSSCSTCSKSDCYLMEYDDEYNDKQTLFNPNFHFKIDKY